MNSAQAIVLAPTTTPVRIAEVLDELEAEAQELRENPEVRYQRRAPSELAPVYTDQTKLKIVLKNLLQNAAKFTNKGRITVDAYQRNNGVIVSIADTGIGKHHVFVTIETVLR
jgi:signal transduction histidine kinase